MSLCYKCITEMDLIKGQFDSYSQCPGCDTPNDLYTTPNRLWVYTFKRYIKGVFVDIVQCDAEDMPDAVAQLSERWSGVFKYSSSFRKD